MKFRRPDRRREAAYDFAEDVLTALDPRWARYEEKMLKHLDKHFAVASRMKVGRMLPWMLVSYAYAKRPNPRTAALMKSIAREAL